MLFYPPRGERYHRPPTKSPLKPDGLLALTRLPLLEAGFSYFRGVVGVGEVVLLGFLHQ